MNKPIVFKGKKLTIQKSKIEPNVRNKTVITDSNWRYVEMWLKRKSHKDALIFWNQAEYFYEASMVLPTESKPLTAYYCYLNATKALLTVKHVSFSSYHGVSGDLNINSKASLSNEMIKIKGGGVLPELAKYLGEKFEESEYSLKDILHNMLYIHRAYIHTFTSDKELYIPIKNPTYVRKEKSTEAWLQFELEDELITKHTINKFPKNFEVDNSSTNGEIIRYKKRFHWNGRDESKSLKSLTNYNKKMRSMIFYINGSNGASWYLKRNSDVNFNIINNGSLTLTFAAMHRLSELSRYHPDVLKSHLESQHNWLLSEFINRSLVQFIDEISSEITGDDFKVTKLKLN